MNTFLSAAKAFIDDERGITAIEYGLIAAVMASAIGAAFLLLTGGLSTSFTSIAGKLTAGS